MFSEAKGMKTYWNLLITVRANGYPIGSKYYMHDAHFKEWCKGKSSEEIMTPRERIKLAKMKAKAAKQSSKKRSDSFMDGDVKRNLSKEEIQEILAKIQALEKESSAITQAAPTSLDIAVNKNKNKEVSQTQEEKDRVLREKVKQMEMKKLADSLNPGDRLAHIKSVGNGL